MREDMLSYKELSTVRYNGGPQLGRYMNDNLMNVCTTIQDLEIGAVRICIVLGVVKKMVVPVLVGSVLSNGLLGKTL